MHYVSLFLADIQSPRFLDCPQDIHTVIDSADNTAHVTWFLPIGTDNSGEDPIITESHGYKPGDRFTAGPHQVGYTITDSRGNQGSSCVFLVNVISKQYTMYIKKLLITCHLKREDCMYVCRYE